VRIEVLRSLWTNGFDLDAALADCRAGRYDGVDGPVPVEAAARAEFVARLRDRGVPLVAEIVTGGGYVPVSADPARHLEDLRAGLERSALAGATLSTVLFGCDSWPLGRRLEVVGRALQEIAAAGVPVAFETHRSRVTFNPWDTAALLRELPDLRLTVDFSHWCAVAERLVMDDDQELLDLCAQRAAHIHARVGYDQGPQVPHPGAPRYADALAAHERWWQRILEVWSASGRAVGRFTCEFGPDGYQQADPFTGATAATLDELNGWMADRLHSVFTEARDRPPRPRLAAGP
jgi:sugar phosphate isomerase/epimerase